VYLYIFNQRPYDPDVLYVTIFSSTAKYLVSFPTQVARLFVASVQCACFVTRMEDSINMCKHRRGASQVPARAVPLFVSPHVTQVAQPEPSSRNSITQVASLLAPPHPCFCIRAQLRAARSISPTTRLAAWRTGARRPSARPWPAVITARMDAGCPANRWCWATLERAGGYSSACADVGWLHAGAVNLVQARCTIRSRCEHARMSRGPYLPDESRKSAAQVRQRRGSSNVNMLVFQVWPPVPFPPLFIPEPLFRMRNNGALSHTQRRHRFRASNGGVPFARPTAASLFRAQRRLLFASNDVSFSRLTAALFSRAQRCCFRAPNGIARSRRTASLVRAKRQLPARA
jgi:hypothetical protein